MMELLHENSPRPQQVDYIVKKTLAQMFGRIPKAPPIGVL